MNRDRFYLLCQLIICCLLVSSRALALDSTWIGGTTGSWTTAANWSSGIPQTANDTATINIAATITVPTNVTIKCVTVNAPVILTVSSGMTIAFSNSGGDVLIASANLLINGSGALTFSRNGASETDFANIKPAAGTTITLAARITGVDGAGIELNAAGILLLTNPDNSFTGVSRVSTGNGTLAFSHPGALGVTAVRLDGNPSRLVYAGSGSASLPLPIQITAGSAIFEHAGGGTLTLSGSIAPVSSGMKTLTFLGTTQTNEVTGSVSNGIGSLSMVAGSGTLLFNGTISDSSLVANMGANLVVGGTALFQTRILSLNSGATLTLNPRLIDGYSATLPQTNLLMGAGVRLVLPAAPTSSTVTMPVLIRSAGATFDIAALTIGTARSKVFIQNFSSGQLPSWFTVNGQPAAYDTTLGVVPLLATGGVSSLSALGPSMIPDDVTGSAVIDAAGTSGGIGLASDPTRVFALIQNHAEHPATVDFSGQTLAASVVSIGAMGHALTLTHGTLSTPTTQTVFSGVATFPSLSIPPIAWFDLADVTTVTTNTDGRIARLGNKGSRGSILDAVVPSDRMGPRYVLHAVNGLNVARADAIIPQQGLATLGNAGISNMVARTVMIVASRSPVSQNSLYAIFLGVDQVSNQGFNICDRPDRTSFATTGNDLEGFPASPVGHNVLTFSLGVNAMPNMGAGYRNGVLLGTKTFSLSTSDAPIHLLHRPNGNAANFSGPGEVAEALVFDYVLSDTDRAAVETYLMQKWRIAAQRDEVLLALRNEHASAQLAVPAALTEAYGTSLSLAKSGPGDVVLSGPVAFSGSLLIDEGTLTLDSPADSTTLLAATISGAGALLKRGDGDLVLSQASPYTGGTTVQGGTLFAGMNGSLGVGPVSIANGAALDIANGSANSPSTGICALTNPITVGGAGPDGLGAVRNSSGVSQQNAFKTVTLTADTALYSASRLDVRGGAFDFGGHALTINGGGECSIVQSVITNVTDNTAIQVVNGMMRLETSDFKGSAANAMGVAPGSGLCLYQMISPMVWSLALRDTAYFRVNNGSTDTNLNVWAGPVSLSSGTARLNALAGGTATITGLIDGDGGLLKDGDGWFWLLNAANRYAGSTIVTQGNLYVASPASLGAHAASGLTVSGSGAVVARIASGTSSDGWSLSELASIATEAVFTTWGTTALGIDTLYENCTYANAWPYIGLKKLGSYTLKLTGVAPDLGALDVYEGELDLTDTGAHNLHTASVTVGMASSSTTVAVVRVAHATLATDDPGYNRAGPALTVASAANARSVFHLGAETAVNGRFLVGNGSGSAGAVYQTSGVVTNTGGSANESRIGENGFGYYRVDRGTFANKGHIQLGRNSGATGILEQRGGSVVINAGSAPANGVVGDYYNGTFTTRAGVGIFQLSGGVFNLNNHSLQLGEWSGENTYSNGFGVFTLENDAQADISYCVLANRNGNPQAYVNLNGGRLTTSYFQKGGNNAPGNTGMAAINFNGGILRIPSSGSLVRTGTNNAPVLLSVYAGGAMIDTPDTAAVLLDQPLQAPVNFGVTSVSLSAFGAGYIAPPAVSLTGGNGTGATAVAEIDLSSGKLTAIRITSPGVGYTTAPTVTLRGGGYTSMGAATATLGTIASGGFTKLGEGSLTLMATSTYTGPTVVSNGTLRLASGNQPLAPASAITLAGGMLDLAGNTLTNNNPVVLANGRLSNGTLSAPAFIKTGTGTVTLAATPQHASDTALFESYVRSLGPIVWYDPSDGATVTLDGTGRVVALLNKGSMSGMDASTGYMNGGFAMTAPLLATGALSYAISKLPMLSIDANRRGLASASNLGLTGSVSRTLIGVMTRDADTSSAVLSFGTAATGQLFELGDRSSSSKVILGCFGGGAYDLVMSPVNPAREVNIYIGSTTSAKVNEVWRTGVDPLHGSTTFSGTVNTGDSRLLIGQRPGTADRSEFRGQIGEVMAFNRVLTESERTELQRLLVKKWMTAQGTVQTNVLTVPVTVSAGTLRLLPNAGVITRLAPIIWYDPSDSATVALDGNGRVTSLLNKGTKPGMPAVAGVLNGGAPLLAPRLATGMLSYAASRLPMVSIDSNNWGLASSGNTDITGSAPRTVAGIFARESNTAGPVTAFGASGTALLYEVGDRQNGNVIGCYGTGNDFIVTPLNPIQQANVHIAANISSNVNAFWRTGADPIATTFTLANSLSTVNSSFFIGQRPTVAERGDFRGQIGEVMVFDRLLTEGERNDLKDYLATKWTQSNGTNNLFDHLAFDVAEGATLDLNGSRANIVVTGTGIISNGVLGAGFVISPSGDDAVGALALSQVTIGEGTVYRLTIQGNACDCLFVDGDLRALTIVPAKDTPVTGKNYVVATGSITHKPMLSGFPDQFILIRNGADLVLTSSGGSVLIIR